MISRENLIKELQKKAEKVGYLEEIRISNFIKRIKTGIYDDPSLLYTRLRKFGYKDLAEKVNE